MLIKLKVWRICYSAIWALLWENRLFAYAKTKTQISFAVTAKLISAFVFATRIVQSLFFLNPKSQVSNNLLWLYSPVCVGPGRKPRRPVFSQRGSYFLVSTVQSFSLFTVHVQFSFTAIDENPCNGFGCVHICFLNAETKPACMCAVGYEPDSKDSKKCIRKYMTSYRNDPMFLKRWVMANRADPDQTAPSVFCLDVILWVRVSHSSEVQCTCAKIYYMSLVLRKMVFGVSDLVRHKPSYTATYRRWLEAWNFWFRQ